MRKNERNKELGYKDRIRIRIFKVVFKSNLKVYLTEVTYNNLLVLAKSMKKSAKELNSSKVAGHASL